MNDPLVPLAARILARRQEAPTIFSWELAFIDELKQAQFHFAPGQFNMLYLYGVGEVAISISSDPEEKRHLRHTIRAVGRVTKAMQQLVPGSIVGIRGPFGQGWPLAQAQGKDVLVITGGLGCAPTVAAINYMMARRADYGHLSILQGVKHSDDLIFRQQLVRWQAQPEVTVYVAADKAAPHWPWRIGYITDMIDTLSLRADKTLVMMCGPEAMMHTAIKALLARGVAEEAIYLSMERNMECGIGQCGHCQLGGWFVCKDGPVFAYATIKKLFTEPGF